MSPQWPSPPMFWMSLLVLLLSASLAQGEPIPSLCFEAPPTDPEEGDLSFRLSSEGGTEFGSAPSGCRGGFDGLLGRAGPWARAAGTAIQATRLMFGIDLNANKLLQFARRFGIAPQAPDRSGIGPFDPQREAARHIRSHFVFRASRRSFFLGFGLQW